MQIFNLHTADVISLYMHLRKLHEFPVYIFTIPIVNVCSACLTLCNPMDTSLPGFLSMEFSRQEFWNSLPFHISGDLPNPGIKPLSLVSPPLAGRFFTTAPLRKPFRLDSFQTWRSSMSLMLSQHAIFKLSQIIKRVGRFPRELGPSWVYREFTHILKMIKHLKLFFKKKKKEKVAFPPRCKQMATIHGYSCFHITFYSFQLLV